MDYKDLFKKVENAIAVCNPVVCADRQVEFSVVVEITGCYCRAAGQAVPLSILEGPI